MSQISLGTINVSVSPFPFVFSHTSYEKVRDIHTRLLTAIKSSFDDWRHSRLSESQSSLSSLSSSSSSSFTFIPNFLSPKITRILLSTPSFPHFGCFRPDFLFSLDGSISICEINARFALNGYLLSVQNARGFSGGKYDGDFGSFFPSGNTLRFPCEGNSQSYCLYL